MENTIFKHTDSHGDEIIVEAAFRSTGIWVVAKEHVSGNLIQVFLSDEERLFQVLLKRHSAREGEVGEWTLARLEGLQAQVCSLKENAVKEMKRLSDLREAFDTHEHHCGRSPQ